jgi:hypothetical protein
MEPGSIRRTFLAALISAEVPVSSFSASKILVENPCLNYVHINFYRGEGQGTHIKFPILQILRPKDDIGVPGYLTEELGCCTAKVGHGTVIKKR